MLKIYLYTLIIFIAIISACTKSFYVPGTGNINEVTTGNDEYNYYYAEGLRLKLLGEKAEAIKCFEKCVSIRPECDAAVFQIGQVLLLAGDPIKAKEYFKRAYALDKSNKWYPVLLMRLYEQLGNTDSMYYYLTKGIELDPDNYELAIKAAELYSERGEIKLAGEVINKIIGKYGLDERNGLILVKGYLEEKNYTKAESIARELVEMFPQEAFFKTVLAEIYARMNQVDKAMQIFGKLIEEQPGDSKVLLWYGNFLIDNNLFNLFFRDAGLVFNNVGISETEKINLILKLFEYQVALKDYGKECEEVISKIENILPLSQPVSLIRAAYYEKTGNTGKLEEYLKNLISRDRRNYFAWEKLLIFYADRSDWDNLYNYAGECSKEFNMSYLAKILFANAALEKGEYNIAVSEANKARIIAGDMKEAVIQAEIIEADARYRNGDFEKAFSIFEELVVKDPENNTVLNNYAYYLAERDLKLEQALKMIKKVIAVEPENNTFLDTYAWILYKKGKTRKALKTMLEIINKDNNLDAEYYEHIGYIYKKLGKCREAVKMWEKAIETDKRKIGLSNLIQKCKK